MKVDTAYKFAPTPPARQSARPAESGGEQVKLSGAADKVGASEVPVDKGRIAEIKAAIAEGRFRINPEAIADSLIRTAQEMIDVQRRI
ncbi:MAG: flagellar biosynthesis anti-sigma factor FlgM [Betaproteobacteria bacterium]|nr:flagellar biosynthesis anti-sigma factor FlgM [Betaproteobacteria bacterium]